MNMRENSSEKYFVKNNKPHFFISGEIHYFRIKPKLWKKHLRLLKETGADAVSTYIPWDWHEIEEGVFDFEGKTHPARNLIRFIELAKKLNLEMIVKPGPYILAEYKNQGLPEWLLKKLNKDSFALDEEGKIISPDLVSYLSDEFLDYTFKWYDAVLPLISRYQTKNGGPISMLQICNEIGVFQWLSGKVDYNPKVVSLYKEFLKEKYQAIENLNSVYSSNFKNFEELNPPVGKIYSKSDYCAYFDFHLFFRHYFNLYISLLKDRIKSYDVDVQLTHNIPGWIYGQASELPMLISTYAEILENHKDILFGVDHIPEFVSFRNAHSDLACNKILKALQPHLPVWAAEFQAGSREHNVKAYANDLESFYFASLAHGMKGFNYYMFSQGINPNGKGYYGRTFYFQTALNADGTINNLYHSIKKVNNFIKKNEIELAQSKTKSEICVGLYKPYFYTELISSQLLKEKRLDVSKLGLSYDPRFIREEILFNGLLRSFQTLNYNYDIYDLEKRNLDDLNNYKQLWVISTELMDTKTQKFLADYVLNGGNLIIYPTIPEYDLYLNPCKIFKTELDLNYHFEESDNLISFMDINDVFTLTKRKMIFSTNNETILALTKNKEACGISKKIGNGEVKILGFLFGYTSDEHLDVINKIVTMDGIRKDIKVNDEDLQITVRYGEKNKFIFLLNYHNEQKFFNYKGKKYIIKPFSYRVIKEKI